MEHLDQLPITIMNKIAGKTGTAQVFSLKSQAYDEDNIADHLKDHSLIHWICPI